MNPDKTIQIKKQTARGLRIAKIMGGAVRGNDVMHWVADAF